MCFTVDTYGHDGKWQVYQCDNCQNLDGVVFVSCLQGQCFHGHCFFIVEKIRQLREVSILSFPLICYLTSCVVDLAFWFSDVALSK